MNIYFTASIVGKKQYIKNYQAIIDQILYRGHTATADHILNTTEEQIRIETSAERKMFHKKLDAWITKADCMIVEGSFPSISVGYEISLALNRGKAVLVLYSNGDPPSLLPELNSERLVLEKYDIRSLPSILDDFLLYASGSNETRFTFFLSREHAYYLSAAAKKSGIPKSGYLRMLLENDSKISK